jgi:hypothetical protein
MVTFNPLHFNRLEDAVVRISDPLGSHQPIQRVVPADQETVRANCTAVVATVSSRTR